MLENNMVATRSVFFIAHSG